MTHTEEMVLRLKDQFNGVMGKAKTNTENTRKATGALNGQVKKLQGLAFKAFGAFAAGKFIAQIGQAGIQMEQTRVSFTTFLGDAEKANKVISDLNKFANFTPFDNNQVIKAGKTLLAFNTPLENLKGDLKAIGDISAGTGKDFNELSTIYGKARIAGTLYAEDINQLVEAGIPIIGEFAKQMKVPESQIKKLASQGKIGFGQLEKAFQNLTGEGGKFNNLMDAQSKTVGGRISTIKGQLQSVQIALGEALLPTLAAIADKLKVFTEFVSKNKAAIASYVPVVVKTVGVIAALIAIVKAYTIVQGILNVVLTANPIGVVIVAIGVLVAMVTIWRKEIIDLIETNKGLQVVLAMAFGPLILTYKLIKFLYDITTNWLQTTESGQAVVKKFVAIMQVLGSALEAVGDYFDDLPNKAVAAFEVIKNKLLGFVKMVQGGVKILLNPMDSEARGEGLKQFQEGQKRLTKDSGDIYRKAYAERLQNQRKEAMRAGLTPGSGPGEGSDSAGGTGLGSMLAAATPTAPAGGSPAAAGGVSGGQGAGRNITISIEQLVGSMTIETTTLQQGSAEIKEMITRALLTAVNDTQSSIS